MMKTAIMIHNMDENTRLINFTQKYLFEGDGKTLLSFSASPRYTPTKGDRLWFYPGCDIPRFKVKQFCIKNDVAVVKYKEKSSVRFMGPDTIKDMILAFNGRIVPKDHFLNWLDGILCNAYMELKDSVAKSQADFVYVYGGAMGSFCKKDLFGTKVLYPRTDTAQYGYERYVEPESFQQLSEMINDTGLKSQDDMLSLLNTGVEMDLEMYTEIHRLFESTDKENTKLAMEALANCDFQKSAVYLLLLLKEYGSKISDSGNKHHVNFKSLIKYFQITNLENISVDDMINALRYQKLLSVDNLNRLMPLAMDKIRESGDMENIKIKDVELSPEAELSVSESILPSIAPPIPLVTDAPTSNQEPDQKPSQEPDHSSLFAPTQSLGFI
jgi:hypothetical protein